MAVSAIQLSSTLFTGPGVAPRPMAKVAGPSLGQDTFSAGGPSAPPDGAAAPPRSGFAAMVQSFWEWITNINFRRMVANLLGKPYVPLHPPESPAAPVPGSPPIPGAPPVPPQNGIPADAIDLSKVIFESAPAYGKPPVDFANWKADSKITNVQVHPDLKNITIEHTMTGKWPKVGFNSHTFDEVEPIEGNVWVFANINGQWHAGAGAWTYCGATTFGAPFMDGDASNYYYNFPEPLRHWAPKSGELVGVAMTTPAREGQWGTAERTNVVMVRWP